MGLLNPSVAHRTHLARRLARWAAAGQLLLCCGVVAAAAPASSPAAAGDDAARPPPFSAEGLPCTARRESRQRDGTIWLRCTLAAPAEVNGLRWRDSIFVDPRGQVREGRLDGDARIGATALPGRTWVALNAGGALEFGFLPRTMIVEGHACRGGGHDYMTHWHANGRLRTCWLDDDEWIDGVPCRSSGWFLFGGVSTEFHDNGRLAACTLAAPATVGGKALPAGTRVQRPSRGD